MDIHTGPAIDWAQILYTFAATTACAFVGTLLALACDRFVMGLLKKNVSVETQRGATVVGEMTHKRPPVYATPEKAAMYEASEGKPIPPHWKR